jgi:hypothetical protein
MTAEEIQGEYEMETGRVIVEPLGRIDPKSVPQAAVWFKAMVPSVGQTLH